MSPDDAASNVSKWIHFLGVHNVPRWLAEQSVDYWFGAALLAGAIIYFYFTYFRNKKQTRQIERQQRIGIEQEGGSIKLTDADISNQTTGMRFRNVTAKLRNILVK